MIKFNQDTMVVPKESSHFGYYAPGQETQIVNMTQLPVFTQDRIGLGQMLKDGKIIFLDTGKYYTVLIIRAFIMEKLILISDGDHLQFTEDFFAQKIVPYL